MKSFSGYTNLPAPVPATCLLLLIRLFMQKIYARYKKTIARKTGKEILTLPGKLLKQIVLKHSCYDWHTNRMNKTDMYQQNLNYPDAYAICKLPPEFSGCQLPTVDCKLQTTLHDTDPRPISPTKKTIIKFFASSNFPLHQISLTYPFIRLI